MTDRQEKNTNMPTDGERHTAKSAKTTAGGARPSARNTEGGLSRGGDIQWPQLNPHGISHEERSGQTGRTDTGREIRRSSDGSRRTAGSTGRRPEDSRRTAGSAGRRPEDSRRTAGSADRRSAESRRAAASGERTREGSRRAEKYAGERAEENRRSLERGKASAESGRSERTARRTHRSGSGRYSGSPADRQLRRLAPFFFIGLGPVVMAYNELALCLMMGKGFFAHPFYVFFFSVALGLLFGAIPGFFPRKYRRIAFGVIFGLIAFYFTVESGIGSSYGTYMTIGNLLQEAGNVAGKYGGQLARSILLGIPKAIVFFLPVVLYCVFSPRFMKKKAYPVQFCAALMVAGLLLTTFFGFVADHSRLVSKAYSGSYTFYNATVNFGLGTSTRLHYKYSLFGQKNAGFHDVEAADTPATPATPADTPVTEENTEGPTENGEAITPAENLTPTPTPVVVSGKNEMDIDFSTVTGGDSIENLSSYLAGKSGTDKNKYTGLFKGKNLIMIAAESYSGVFISQELTPTLWRLTHNGFYFSDYYQPEWGGSTTTGEMSYLCGLAPQWGDESMTNTVGHNMYFTMGNQLQRLGYNSAAFHNGSYDYYTRYNTHPNLGYDQWIANETGIGDICGYHYPEDDEFFEKTIPLYIDKQPFNIYYMTLSGHAPYEKSRSLVDKYYDRVNEVVGDEYKETTKYYICYMMELEAALTRMVNSLEEAGIADDTVIVMVGDHFPYGLGSGDAWGNDEDYVVDLLKTERSLEWNRDRNTLVIWSGCLENANKDMACEISTPTFSLDVLPTLSNLFGLEYDSRLLVGRDVFSEAEPLVFWNTLDWVTTRGRYEAASDTWYGNDGYEEYDWDYIDSINKQVENRLLMSRVIVLNDYYGLIFGEDTVTEGGSQTIYTGPVTG